VHGPRGRRAKAAGYRTGCADELLIWEMGTSPGRLLEVGGAEEAGGGGRGEEGRGAQGGGLLQ